MSAGIYLIEKLFDFLPHTAGGKIAEKQADKTSEKVRKYLGCRTRKDVSGEIEGWLDGGGEDLTIVDISNREAAEGLVSYLLPDFLRERDVEEGLKSNTYHEIFEKTAKNCIPQIEALDGFGEGIINGLAEDYAKHCIQDEELCEDWYERYGENSYKFLEECKGKKEEIENGEIEEEEIEIENKEKKLGYTLTKVKPFEIGELLNGLMEIPMKWDIKSEWRIQDYVKEEMPTLDEILEDYQEKKENYKLEGPGGMVKNNQNDRERVAA